MALDLFQLSQIPSDHLTGIYDVRLIILSFMVATCASYIALDLTGRLRDLSNTRTSRLLWLLGGAIAMGSGIWSMHFIGMLSFTIPGLVFRYEFMWTAISLAVAIIASGFALFILQASIIRIEHYILGGIVLGLAIASMHYSGMEAMLISLNIRYLPSLFFLSILVAIVASEAAFWLAIKSTQIIMRLRTRMKLISSIIMGVGICGMHYTGMAASVFTPLCTKALASDINNALDPAYLSIAVAGVTFIILGIAFLASNYKESLNQQQFEKARQLGMAEISASVLHNVGNVLNSVNVSANTLAERISSSKMQGLTKLVELFNENKQDLAAFLQEPRGVKSLEFLDRLAHYWDEEQKNLNTEMNSLTKNISLIKDIISTHQAMSRTTDFDQIISTHELLNEALLITGVNTFELIKVNKQYGKIPPIRIDKNKLLQIFVNLIKNAKEAMLESSNTEKILTIKTALLNKNRLQIEIGDTGIGIARKDATKVFSYGFTTKEQGHGFGLHTSALAINTMGGSIQIKSEGHEKGTTIILEIPIYTPRTQASRKKP